MPSAGELLRYEREKRNRTISEISSETCISTRYLQAIETGDTEILPGYFYHRSFIRQYADCLKLDTEVTKRIFETIEPAPEIDPIPVFSIPQQIAQVEQRSRPLAHVPTRVAATLLFIVLAGCSGVFALWNRAQEAADPALQVVLASSTPEPAQPVAYVPAPADALQEPPEPNALEANAAAPVAKSPAVKSVSDTVAVAHPGTISVDLAATEKTWVSVSSEGTTVYAGTLDPEQTKNFALNPTAKLLTGNAAGLDVRMNGRSLGPLGPRGHVRMVLFSPDRFRILSPRKM